MWFVVNVKVFLAKKFCSYSDMQNNIWACKIAWKEVTRNRVSLHDSLGLNLRILRVIYTINHVIFMQFLVCFKPMFQVFSHEKSCRFHTKIWLRTHEKSFEFYMIYRVNHTRNPEIKPERIV